MNKIYRVSASEEEKTILRINNLVERQIIGFFPTDKADCVCQPLIKDMMLKFSIMRPEEIKGLKMRLGELSCPASKEGKQLFYITCSNCGSTLGRCYASDETLSDWVDLHYICSSVMVTKKVPVEVKETKINDNGEQIEKVKNKMEVVQSAYWQGALSVNISPIDEKLGFECACGADTRDFRANQTLDDKIKQQKIKESSKGRHFGKKDSKFVASPVS